MKIYVAVELTIDEAGVMHPQRILWEDGRKFEISSDFGCAARGEPEGRRQRHPLYLPHRQKGRLSLL